MSMSSFKSRAALTCLLLIHISSGCLGTVIDQHLCIFDEIHKDSKENLPAVTLVEEIPQKGEKAGSSTLTAVTLDWNTIRIRTSSVDLEDESKYCKDTTGSHKTVSGEDKTCTEKDIVTDEKRQLMRRVVRSAIEMHSTMLTVQQIKGGFKVPEFTSPFCNRFTVPESHRLLGVQDADMVLYLSFSVHGSKYHFAAGAPCAQLPSGRPVVGAITYDIQRLMESPYSVRVAMHEIAHALGFSYKLMEKIDSVKPKQKDNVRGKSHVMEVQGVKTVEKTKEQFGCQTATGMELEDENGLLTVPSRSHWERRNAKDELMAGIVGRGYYTALTLGFFEDTGYYKAFFTMAESMEWGKNAECDFLTTPCIKNGYSQFLNMFCTDAGYYFQCTQDNRAIGKCSGVIESTNDLPTQYRYFSEAKKSGGSALMTDRCPIVEEQEGAGCNDESGSAPGKKDSDSICVRKKALSETKINNGNDEGICSIVLLDTPNTVKLDYKQASGPDTCTDNAVTAKSPFDGVELVCPTYEEAVAAAGKKSKELFLLIGKSSYGKYESDNVSVIELQRAEDPKDPLSENGEGNTNPSGVPAGQEQTATKLSENTQNRKGKGARNNRKNQRTNKNKLRTKQRGTTREAPVD